MSLTSERSSTRNQYLAAFAVNIITLAHGCALYWLSPFLPYLRSNDTHLTTGPVNSDEVSWIGSSISIGGICGTILFGKIAHRFGKRTALILLVFPHFAFWLGILFSTQINHLYIARFCAGITGGGTLRTVSLFITEISENKIRGKLGSYMILFLCLGTLFVFIAGNFLSFFTVPIIMMILPTVYLISVLFLPDTPASLMSRHKFDEAWESLKFYRSCGSDKVAAERFRAEYELLRKTSDNGDYEKPEFRDFLTKPVKRGLMLGLFLMFLNQYSGSLVILTYTADIFKSSGSSLTPNESSVVVAIIQLIGVYISTICVEKFGRKILMVVSCTGASIFFFILATYSYLKETGFDVSKFNWVPIVSLSLVIFIESIGIISISFVITTELMPNKIRNAACTICISAVTAFAFSILKIFPPMVKMINLHGCMLVFSGVCLLGTFITLIFIPETKGKSLIAADDEAEGEACKMLEPPGNIDKKVRIILTRKGDLK